MKADLWVCPPGQAKLAAGREIDYCDLAFSSPGTPMENNGWIKIDTLIVEAAELPDRETCVKITLERLSQQEATLREKLNEDLARIEQMRSEMLSLEMAPVKAKTEEADDAIPF